MTQPARTGQFPSPPATSGPPAKPQPAAPLTDEQMRVKCIELAIAAKVDSRFITEAAAKFHDYVKSGTTSSGTAAYGHGG